MDTPKRGRPIRGRGLSVELTIRLDPEMDAEFRAFAAHLGWPLAAAARQLIGVGLKAEGFRHVPPPPDMRNHT